MKSTWKRKPLLLTGYFIKNVLTKKEKSPKGCSPPDHVPWWGLCWDELFDETLVRIASKGQPRRPAKGVPEDLSESPLGRLRQLVAWPGGVFQRKVLCPCLLLLSTVSNGGFMAWVTDKALYVDSPRAIPAPLYELGLARASYVVCRFDSMTLRSMVADILCLRCILVDMSRVGHILSCLVWNALFEMTLQCLTKWNACQADDLP